MTGLRRDSLFLALTRPQMFIGVTYGWCVANGVVSAELFVLFKSFWIVPLALAFHLVGVLLALHEPRFFELWITRISCCPRVRNYKLWACNSYRP